MVSLFNEINPFGICEIRFACEIWLRHVKCAAARGIYFISLDVSASNFTMTTGHYFTFGNAEYFTSIST